MKYSQFTTKTSIELFDMFCKATDTQVRYDIIGYFGELYYQKILDFLKPNKDLDKDELLDILYKTFYEKFYNAILSKKRMEEPIDNVADYLRKIAKNLSLDLLKTKNNNKYKHDSINEDKKNNDEESVENEKLFSLIDNSLESNNVANELLPTQILLSQLILCFLNEEQSLYLYLYYYQDKKAKEIAKELNLTIGQVEGKIERGREKIKELKTLVGNVFDSELELSEAELLLALERLQVFDESQRAKWAIMIHECSFYESWKETLRLILLLFEKLESEQVLRFLKIPKLLHLPAQDKTEASQKLRDKNLTKIQNTLIRWQKLFRLHTEVLTT